MKKFITISAIVCFFIGWILSSVATTDHMFKIACVMMGLAFLPVISAQISCFSDSKVRIRIFRRNKQRNFFMILFAVSDFLFISMIESAIGFAPTHSSTSLEMFIFSSAVFATALFIGIKVAGADIRKLWIEECKKEKKRATA